jgi:hypothetical protein
LTIDEIDQKWIINVMFAKADNVLNPEDAVQEAEAACKRIWDEWRERKVIYIRSQARDHISRRHAARKGDSEIRRLLFFKWDTVRELG